MKNSPPVEKLTAREIQIISLAAHGKKHKEIATDLKIDHLTVRSHLANIRAKFKVGNTVGAVSRAISQGLISI